MAKKTTKSSTTSRGTAAASAGGLPLAFASAGESNAAVKKLKEALEKKLSFKSETSINELERLAVLLYALERRAEAIAVLDHLAANAAAPANAMIHATIGSGLLLRAWLLRQDGREEDVSAALAATRTPSSSEAAAAKLSDKRADWPRYAGASPKVVLESMANDVLSAIAWCESGRVHGFDVAGWEAFREDALAELRKRLTK